MRDGSKGTENILNEICFQSRELGFGRALRNLYSDLWGMLKQHLEIIGNCGREGVWLKVVHAFLQIGRFDASALCRENSKVILFESSLNNVRNTLCR